MAIKPKSYTSAKRTNQKLVGGQMIKVGDLVKPNHKFGMNWDQEEIRLGEKYVVSEVNDAKDELKYVQLEGVYSSYPIDAVVHYKRRKEK